MSAVTERQTDVPDRHPKGTTIFDISTIDLDARIHDRSHIEKFIPHRHDFLLVDGVVWESDDYKQGIGVYEPDDDAFWAHGHFPGHPMMPGVLMVEAAAQMSCYLYNVRDGMPKVVILLRMENVAFRAGVVPGQKLYLLCSEVKAGRRKFVCDMQGLVDGKVAFNATIHGMRIEDPEP